MTDVLAKVEEHARETEANNRVVQMRLSHLVEDRQQNHHHQYSDNEDDDENQNDSDNDEDEENEDDTATSGGGGSPVPTGEISLLPDGSTTGQKNKKKNKTKKSKSSKTMKEELKKAQEQQSIFTFLFLLIFFIGVSAIIHMGDARELFHFLEEGWRIEVYLDRVCYCNSTFVGLDVCEAMGDNWVVGDPTSIIPISFANPSQLYCLELDEDINVCDNFRSRLNATHIMIVVLFATFVVINVVALAISVVTVLRRVLAEKVDFLQTVFKSLSKVFGPALLCAVMFVPAATLVGLSASGVMLSLFIDTMCRETPDSFFVRPVMYRTDFTLGSGAIFILVGTLTGFLVLIGGIVWTVKSRAALSELHEKQREEQLRELLRQQRRMNVSEKSSDSKSLSGLNISSKTVDERLHQV